jgi:hypothetical protein
VRLSPPDSAPFSTDALFVWLRHGETYSTAELGKVPAGERPQPSVEEELPAFEWSCFERQVTPENF